MIPLPSSWATLADETAGASDASAKFPGWPLPPGHAYGTLLNRQADVARLQKLAGGDWKDSVYKAAPQAPVLYLKTPNTYAEDGARVALDGLDAVELGACLGLVFARRACGVGRAEALSYLAGYVPMLDLAEPHLQVHRPAVRQRCRDGFCVMAPQLLAEPPALLQLEVNGTPVQQLSPLQGLVREAAQLIADVSAFMTLEPGDVLHLGAPLDAPRGRAGDQVRLRAGGSQLTLQLIEEQA